MENGKFIQTVIQMQNVPRWDEYAPHFKDNAASHSFRCAAYALLAALIEEKVFNRKVDKFKVVARALFHDINETQTSSIKHNTKKDPAVREKIEMLEKNASEEIVSYVSKSLQPYFKDFIVDAEDDTYEGRIVDAIDTFDAMVFCYRESTKEPSVVVQNSYSSELSDFYKSMINCINSFEVKEDNKGEVLKLLSSLNETVKGIESKREAEAKENHKKMSLASDARNYFQIQYVGLEQQLLSTEVDSVKWLVQEFAKFEGIFDFVYSILMMDTIQRWKGSFNVISDNDATHTFRATALSVFNGLLEREKYGKKDIDMFMLAGKTLFHDLVEAVTGDILGPVKHSSPETKAAFEEYEKSAAMGMIKKLPDFLQADIIEMMVEAKNDTYEGELVNISDKLDALIKSNLEMKINNEYSDTYYNQLQKIQRNFENESVIFFLAYILHDITFGNKRS